MDIITDGRGLEHGTGDGEGARFGPFRMKSTGRWWGYFAQGEELCVSWRDGSRASITFLDASLRPLASCVESSGSARVRLPRHGLIYIESDRPLVVRLERRSAHRVRRARDFALDCRSVSLPDASNAA